MRKIALKLAAVVLSLSIMCAVTAFSTNTGAGVKQNVQVIHAASHQCGRYTRTVYGEWRDTTGFWAGLLFGAAERTRTVETYCLGCGSKIGSYEEVQHGSRNQYGVITWYNF